MSNFLFLIIEPNKPVFFFLSFNIFFYIYRLIEMCKNLWMQILCYSCWVDICLPSIICLFPTVARPSNKQIIYEEWVSRGTQSLWDVSTVAQRPVATGLSEMDTLLTWQRVEQMETWEHVTLSNIPTRQSCFLWLFLSEISWRKPEYWAEV